MPTLRLVRPHKHIVLTIAGGSLVTKGDWKVLEADPTSALLESSGQWENWILGSPGNSNNMRLYDKSDHKVMLLKGYTEGNSSGDGEIMLPGFGGTFGDDPFQWFLGS